jgi:hypothetical protein
MEKDWFTCITDEVRDEAIENYLMERRIVELQIEELQCRGEEVRVGMSETGKRLSRLGYWISQPEIQERLIKLLKFPQPSVWEDCLRKGSIQGIGVIHVYALTNKEKFKKIVREVYCRFYKRMEGYSAGYEDLKAECRAVNCNIESFHKNHSLLTVLSFVRSLDVCAMEKSRFLGGNFTAGELAYVEQNLRFQPVSLEQMKVPPPISLLEPNLIKDALKDLARDIFRKYQRQVEHLMSEAENQR